MRIVVADDHSLFRDGLVSLLEAAGHEIVGQAGDGRAAVDMVLETRPDIVLLDLAMPILDGHEALRQIHAAAPEVKIVVLTVSDEDADLRRAVQAGAQGYLLKSLNADQFLELLAGLQKGEAAITRKMTARLMAQWADTADDQEPAPDRLTERELQLLQLVSLGLSNRAIAQRLSISLNTVKYHLKNILQKLDVQNRTEAVAIAIRDGLLDQKGADTSERS
jgi:DNA-binding NarL/FixJ family response regulator